MRTDLTFVFQRDLPLRMDAPTLPSSGVFFALLVSVHLTPSLRAQVADSKDSRPASDLVGNILRGSQTEEDIRSKNREADRSLIKQLPLTRGLKYDEERGTFLDHSDGLRGHGYHLTTEGDWTQLFDATTASDWRTYKEEKSGDVVSFNPKISEVDRNRNSKKYEAYLIEPEQETGARKNGPLTNSPKKMGLNSYQAVNPKTGQMETYIEEPPNPYFPLDPQEDPRQKKVPLKTYSGVNPKTGERETYVEEPLNPSFPVDPQDDPRQKNVPLRLKGGSEGGYLSNGHYSWYNGPHGSGWMDDPDRSNNGSFRKGSQMPIGGAPLLVPSTTPNSPKPTQLRVQPDGSTLDDAIRKNENNFLRYGQTAQSWSEFCKKERERAALGTSENGPKNFKNQKSESNLFVSPEGKIATLPRLDSPNRRAPSNPSAVSTPAEPNANRHTLPHLNISQQIIASGLMPLPKPDANGYRGQATSPLAASASDWGKLNRGEIKAKPAPSNPNGTGTSKSDPVAVQQRALLGGASNNVPFDPWSKSNKSSNLTKSGPTESSGNSSGTKVPGTSLSTASDSGSKGSATIAPVAKPVQSGGLGQLPFIKTPPSPVAAANTGGSSSNGSGGGRIAQPASSSGLGQLPFIKTPPSPVAAANTGGSSRGKSSPTHSYDNTRSYDNSASDASFSSSFRMPVIQQYVDTPLVVPHISTPAPSHYNPPVSFSHSLGSGHH